MNNSYFLKIAENLKPALVHKRVILYSPSIEKENKVIFDFGTHFVGYPAIHLSIRGERNDCPSLLKVRFCETKQELEEDTSSYNGWISKSWIQEEIIHIDEFPSDYVFQRRYSFRYVEISIISTSSKCSLCFVQAEVDALTSCDIAVEEVNMDAMKRKIDKIALKTLSECMQDVFEDGPKRDRRLWLGDLWLEAKTNYLTFKKNNLAKRCLYLFAGFSSMDGYIPQSIYGGVNPTGEKKSMFDYSLLFIPTLSEYYKATGDKDAVVDLLPLAIKQIEIAKRDYFDGDLIMDRDELGWAFLDWSLELNKQAGAQAVYIYAEKELIKLLSIMNEDSTIYQEDVQKKEKAAYDAFFDKSIQLFVSGKEKQVSYASNIWCVLAGILSKDENKSLLLRLSEYEKAIKPITPYLMHCYVESLFLTGLENKACDEIDSYWGKMADLGADTFYELFNPKNPDESPYGGNAVHSYCHGWSCTPAYFYRKYLRSNHD